MQAILAQMHAYYFYNNWYVRLLLLRRLLRLIIIMMMMMITTVIMLYNNNNKNNVIISEEHVNCRNKRTLFTTNHIGEGAGFDGVNFRVFFRLVQSQRCFGAGASFRPRTQKNSLPLRNNCCLLSLTTGNGASNFSSTFRTTRSLSTTNI